MRKKATEDAVWTMSVPECGRHYLGLGKWASYEAARQGIIPTIAIGRKLRALPRVLEARLEADKKEAVAQ